MRNQRGSNVQINWQELLLWTERLDERMASSQTREEYRNEASYLATHRTRYGVNGPNGFCSSRGCCASCTRSAKDAATEHLVHLPAGDVLEHPWWIHHRLGVAGGFAECRRSALDPQRRAQLPVEGPQSAGHAERAGAC